MNGGYCGKIKIILAIVGAVVIAILLFVTKVIIPNNESAESKRNTSTVNYEESIDGMNRRDNGDD